MSLARTAFPVLLVVLLFRSFLFEPFRIPSASMMPGLVDGDFILVNKFNYGLRLPVLNTKILSTWGATARGCDRVPIDLGAAAQPDQTARGPAGEITSSVQDNRLSINGTPVALAPAGEYSGGYGFSGAALERKPSATPIT